MRQLHGSAILFLLGCSGAGGVDGPPAPAPPDNAIATLTISPKTASIGIDGRLTLGVTARNAGGTVVPAAGISWATSDPGIVTVASTGIVSGHGEGDAMITVRSGAAADTARVKGIPVIHLGSLDNVQVFAMATGEVELIVGRLGAPTSPPLPFVMGLDRHVIGLPLLTGFSNGIAAGVSDSGVAVGTTGNAVAWTRGVSGQWQVERLPWSEGSTQAAGVSSNAVFVAGSVGTALRWYPGRWTRAPDRSWSVERLPVPEGMFGQAKDVNNVGDVVGAFFHLQTGNQAVLWRRDAGGAWQTELLGAPGDDGTGAYAINDAGTVVGRNGGVPVIWTKSGGVWTERPLLPASPEPNYGWASGINAAGEVAGTVSVAGVQQAFRWSESGGAKILQSLVTAGSGWGINAAGEVVAVSYNPTDLATSQAGTLWRKR